MQRTLAPVFASALALAATATSASAASYKLSCDDNSIFEGPLSITIDTSAATATAAASGNFSGPGGAIFSVDYAHLAVSSLATTSTQALKKVSITGTDFSLKLKANAAGVLKGKLSTVSTDDDAMPYVGKVACTVEQ